MKNRWIYVLLLCSKYCLCTTQIGPDPWDYDTVTTTQRSPVKTPPDLRNIITKNTNSENNFGMNEWFFKRILAIVLKGGQVKENEDNSVDVSLQMKFQNDQWSLFNEYLKSNKPFTEEVLRRITGYVEEAIYKPSVTEKIVMTWNEYIQVYLTEYREQITWILTIITFKITLLWLIKRMSRKHILLMTFANLYCYEVITSYKEAEQKDLERFLSAINKCKWYFWSSNCEMPRPDPLIFLKHMNPLKIAIRIFTLLISEPILTISDALKTITHGITDGLWFPLNVVLYGMLMVFFNALVIILFIMLFFHYILNRPFNIHFLGLSMGLMQQNKPLNTTQQTPKVEECDRISGATLEKFLDVCSQALSSSNRSKNVDNALQLNATRNTNIRRSASTGRLQYLDNDLPFKNNMLTLESKQAKNNIRNRGNGSGDA